jgi:tellurite resistance protein TehA-like permease
MKPSANVLSWLVVSLVGAIVVVLVVALSLFPRLNAAQNLINDAQPVFTADRVAGDRAAIDMVDKAVTLTDQVATPQGAAAEVPKLIAYVSKQTGLPSAAVLKALQTRFPHTTALLQAMPLTSVSSELPDLMTFLATTLKMTPAQVDAALKQNFPALHQAITALPPVTRDWNSVPGTAELTTTAGEPVRSVPQVATYFSNDVVPVLERQQGNFQSLASKGGVGYLDILLLVLGLIVIVFGLVMAYLASRGGLPRSLTAGAWSVVVVVGLLVVGLVAGLSLFPRLSNGDALLKDARGVFDQTRVSGDRAAINMLSQVVQVADPIATPAGGAAAEVPKLIAFVSKQAKLPSAAVLKALQTNFPHTTALLQAIPLSSVSAELPGLMRFLSSTLGAPPAQVTAALRGNFPHLYQAIVLLPQVTGGWSNVPGTEKLTRFDGTTPVRSISDIRTYFSADVIPVLERQQANFQRADTTWPPLPVFPPLLLVVGLLVTVYGIVMLLLTLRAEPAQPAPAAPSRAGARSGR